MISAVLKLATNSQNHTAVTDWLLRDNAVFAGVHFYMSTWL